MSTSNDRNGELERYLGGEAPLEEFSEGFLREEARLKDLLGSLREDHRAPPSLRGAVMREIRSRPVPGWRRLVAWWIRPQEVRITPAWAGAFGMAALALLWWVGPARQGAPGTAGSLVSSSAGEVGSGSASVERAPTGGSSSPAVVNVTRFVLIAPEARSVHLTGDFSEWSPEGIALEELRGTGVWTVDVPLTPGIYQYTFILDGTEWRPDPRAVSQIDDGFGRTNSVLIIPGGSGGAV